MVVTCFVGVAWHFGMPVGVGGVGVGLVFVLTFAPWSVFTLISTSRRRSCIAFASGQRYVPGGGSSGDCRTQRTGRPFFIVVIALLFRKPFSEL